MPLNKKQLILEGLVLHCGHHAALTAWSRFHKLYSDKHGSCLEYCRENQESDSFIRYTNREMKVWDRYALMFARVNDRQKQQQRYDLAVPLFAGRTPVPLRTGYE